ncbi:cytochrome c biogenesis protein CcsA, partial [Streptomyces lavendulocolor]
MNPTTTADQTLAQLSNWLIYSAIAVYLLAFLTHCAEWAFGSRNRIARLAATPATHRTSGAGTAAEGRTGLRTGSAPGTAVLAPPTADRKTENANGPQVGHGADSSDQRSDLLGRIGVSLTTLAFLLHLASVVTRAWSVGRPPWGNMYEFSTAFALAATGTYLGLLAARKQVRWLGLPVAFSVLLTLGLAVTVLYVDSAQLVPALDSYWLWIHVSAAIISGGAFHTAAVATLLYLARDRW